MPNPHPGVLTRAWRRFRRVSDRAVDRARSRVVRASIRGIGSPIPPGRLIRLVTGTENAGWFLDSGALAVKSLRDILAGRGRTLESFDAVLDFGCGSGRVLRHMSSVRGPAFHGVDYNPDLIAWCRKNLEFAEFHVNGIDRGLETRADTYDFIFALSVFTHLSEALQLFWINELARVLRAGGYLLITTHGAHYLGQLSMSEQEKFRAGELVVRKAKRPGSNDCAAFHPEDYVRKRLARGLEVVDYIAEGALGNPRQDVYLLKKPARTRV